jgi:hypothetical protein
MTEEEIRRELEGLEHAMKHMFVSYHTPYALDHAVERMKKYEAKKEELEKLLEEELAKK